MSPARELKPKLVFALVFAMSLIGVLAIALLLREALDSGSRPQQAAREGRTLPPLLVPEELGGSEAAEARLRAELEALEARLATLLVEAEGEEGAVPEPGRSRDAAAEAPAAGAPAPAPRQKEEEARVPQEEPRSLFELARDLGALTASLEERVEALEAEARRAREQAREGPAPARLASLNAEIRELERDAAELRLALRREQEESSDLMAKLAEVRAERDRALAESRGAEAALSGCFVIAATDGELRALRRAGIIERGLSGYRVAEKALGVGRTERTIAEVEGSAEVIYLGERVRSAEILSVHEQYPGLWNIETRGGQLAIVLRDPIAFWRIGRYLIVQVEG